MAMDSGDPPFWGAMQANAKPGLVASVCETAEELRTLRH
jgi:hypothetical protein